MNLPISIKPRFLLTAISICMAATSVFAQDCLTPSANDLYVDKDASDASDNNNGRYDSNGGTGPFATIQKLVNTLAPGQCGWVKASAKPYYEVGKVSGAPTAGITFNKGGTSESARIIVSGYPGQRPVINQERVTPSGSWGAAGFYIFNGSYITIRNFEILNTTSSSIEVSASAGAQYITIEGNHLHHSYASENAGGVRLDSCNYCVVSNNTINHHYRTMSGYTSNILDSLPYGLNAGIHGFEPGASVIKNNLIYNVDKGVQLKQADQQHLDAYKISGNIFVNMASSAYNLQLQGAGMSAPRNTEFFNNIVYYAPIAVSTDLSEASEQAVSMKIYNNTLINTAGLAAIENFSNVEIYNNLMSGTTSAFASSIGTPKVLVTNRPGSYVNSITYYDYNLYYNAPSYWNLGRDTSSDKAFSSLSTWRTATHTDLKYAAPDAKSLTSNPVFASSSGGATKLLTGSSADYALGSGSPAKGAGRNGLDIGAVRAGVIVGLLSSNGGSTSTAVAPNPPATLKVQAL